MKEKPNIYIYIYIYREREREREREYNKVDVFKTMVKWTNIKIYIKLAKEHKDLSI